MGEGLKNGQISGMVLEAPGRTMLVGWQKDGQAALLTCLYREGSASGFIGDCRVMLERVQGVLREWGVHRLFVSAGIENPNFTRLMRYYRRLGFRADLVRSAKEI